jgi:hypothetical protein
MSVPLLGPFRLTARSFASPAGVVYAGLDPAGSPLEVVVLTRGAASDPAARDRFAAAVREFSGLVVASDTESSEPWAAGGPGLERTLSSVLLTGRSRGPQFLPYWAGAEEPAFPSGRRAPIIAPKRESPKGPLLALLALLIFALLFGGLLLALFWLQPAHKDHPEPPAQDSVSASGGTTAPPTPSGSPSASGSGSPSPSGSGTGTPTKRPTGSPSGSGDGTPGDGGPGDPRDDF